MNLNNCPFCNSEHGKVFDPSEGTSPLADIPCLKVSQDYFPFDTSKPYFFVQCNVCGAFGPKKTTFNEAVESWNSRFENKSSSSLGIAQPNQGSRPSITDLIDKYNLTSKFKIAPVVEDSQQANRHPLTFKTARYEPFSILVYVTAEEFAAFEIGDCVQGQVMSSKYGIPHLCYVTSKSCEIMSEWVSPRRTITLGFQH